MGLEDEQVSPDELVARVERLQQAHPTAALQGHDVCADIHTALHVAETLIISRDRRAFAGPASESTDGLRRELRAMGLEQATPQLVAMVAVVDAAVDQLADASAGDRQTAWEKMRKDVLRRHCLSPTTGS